MADREINEKAADPVVNERRESIVKPLEAIEVTNMNLGGDTPIHPPPLVSDAEKAEVVSIDDTKLEIDPFKPFPDEEGLPIEEQILTFRAIIVGCCLGALVNASNVYLGLKTGWTFGANLFGAIFGFGIVKSMSIWFPNVPIVGGYFGPKENSIVQTAASAAGGLGGIFVSAIPALYQLNLLSASPADDFWRILTFTLVCSYFGLLVSTPLRKFFIVHMARELRLIFPTATATAMTIRSMHAVGSGAAQAMKKTKALMITFVVCIALRVASYYAVGILWDWHVFTWFFIWGNYQNAAIYAENWGWFIEWTPAFIGSGLLVGLNTAISMMFGSILAWGIIGPALVKAGVCYGVHVYPDDPKWGEVVSFYSFSKAKTNPSPRYWLLWPGVLLMICVSFAELFLQYKTIWMALKSVWTELNSGASKLAQKRGKHVAFFEKHKTPAEVQEDRVVDPAPESQQVKTWMWAPSLLIVIVVACVVLGVQYGESVGVSILALLLALVFAFLAIQCTGVTDITPLTAAAKASQLVFGGVTHGSGGSADTLKQAQRLNLIAGAVASGCASQAADLTVDFRVGFLLKTPPNIQWYAQAMGSIVAVWLAPGMFLLFAKAYPCILDAEAEKCAFQVPSVAAWRAIAIAVTDPDIPIPKSSGIFAILVSALGVATVIFRHYYLVGAREKWRIWVPNWMAIALSFVLPSTVYSTAMLIGATVSYIWLKKNLKSFDTYCYAIAAGMIAGEGLGGVIGAILQIAGVAGDVYGSGIACPGDTCY